MQLCVDLSLTSTDKLKSGLHEFQP